MTQLYLPMLSLHNILRWIVVIVALYALFRYFSGLLSKREYTSGDRQSGLFYTIALDVQLLVGILLYFFISPVTTSAFANFGVAMQDSQTRFFLMEHNVLMLVAVIFVHVGSVMVRRVAASDAKFRRGAIWYSLTTLAILAAIPWWRPLLRLPF